MSYDKAFGDAVRMAATGLRTTSRMDPEIEAAPLAAILRSDRALDADGLELLARLVTGNLRKIAPRAGESMLAHAVRRAGTAWRHGKDMDPATTGAVLAACLRSNHARLEPGERALLADLMTGDLRRGTSAPTKGPGHSQIVAVVEAFHRKIDAGTLRKNALIETASELRISIRTIENHLKRWEDRNTMSNILRFNDET